MLPEELGFMVLAVLAGICLLVVVVILVLLGRL